MRRPQQYVNTAPLRAVISSKLINGNYRAFVLECGHRLSDHNPASEPKRKRCPECARDEYSNNPKNGPYPALRRVMACPFCGYETENDDKYGCANCCGEYDTLTETTTMTRKQLEARANKVGLTITGRRGEYYLDRLDTDYLDRRPNGYRSLAEVAVGIEFREMQQEA
jgi:hypothetical protein